MTWILQSGHGCSEACFGSIEADLADLDAGDFALLNRQRGSAIERMVAECLFSLLGKVERSTIGRAGYHNFVIWDI